MKKDALHTNPAERAENAGKKSLPLAEQAYQHLVGAIRSGALNPGDRVVEGEIAKELNISRTPVREAFRRLHSEGRLNIEPQKGAFVAELDLQEISELYALRENVEGMAAAFAARHASDAEIAAMFDIVGRSKEFQDDPRSLNQINWELHHVIFAAARNRYLKRVVALLAEDFAMLRGVRYIPESRPAALIDEHERLVEAIAKRDPEAAKLAATAHVQNAYKMHLDALLRTTRDQMATVGSHASLPDRGE